MSAIYPFRMIQHKDYNTPITKKTLLSLYIDRLIMMINFNIVPLVLNREWSVNA